MEILDPTAAIYTLFIDEQPAALLYEPRFEEMFWCSYRLEARCARSERLLREERLWQEVGFTIRADKGVEPNPLTISGAYQAFCAGETDRMAFRSLWPPAHRIVQPPKPQPRILRLLTRLLGRNNA